MFYVYILRLNDGRLYVGYSKDPRKRLNLHKKGGGAFLTRQMGVRTLLYQESHPTIESAKKREKQLKGWSRAKKYALITGDLARLKMLSKKKT